MTDTPEIAAAKRKLELQATELPNWARQLLDYIADLERRAAGSVPEICGDSRGKVAQAMIRCGLTTGHGDTLDAPPDRGQSMNARLLALMGLVAVAEENAKKHCAKDGHDFRPAPFSESGERTIGRTCHVCGERESLNQT